MTRRFSLYANSFVDNDVMFGLVIQAPIFDWIRSLSTHEIMVMLQHIDTIYYDFFSSSPRDYFAMRPYIFLNTNAHIKSSERLQFSASICITMRVNFAWLGFFYKRFSLLLLKTHTQSYSLLLYIYGLTHTKWKQKSIEMVTSKELNI
jgi:hypothetical protein